MRRTPITSSMVGSSAVNDGMSVSFESSSISIMTKADRSASSIAGNTETSKATPPELKSKTDTKYDRTPVDCNSSRVSTEALLDWSRDLGCSLPCRSDLCDVSFSDYVSNIHDTHLQCDVMDLGKGDVQMPHRARSIQSLLVQSTTMFAQQTALVDGMSGENWCTYMELGVHVRRVASGLQKVGFCRGERLILVCPPCPEAIVSMLATFTLGAIFVPLSPDFSQTHLGLPMGYCDHIGIVGVAGGGISVTGLPLVRKKVREIQAVLLKHLQVLKPSIVMMSGSKWCMENTLWAAGSCASVKRVYVLGGAQVSPHSFNTLLQDDGTACPNHIGNCSSDIAIIVHTTDFQDCSRFFKFTYANLGEHIQVITESPQIGLDGQGEVLLVGLPLTEPFVLIGLICVGLARGFTLITLSQPNRVLRMCQKHKVTILPLTTHWISKLSKIQKGSLRKPVLPAMILVCSGGASCNASQLDVLHRRGAEKVVFAYCVAELMGPVAACTLTKDYQALPDLEILRGVAFKVIDPATNKTLDVFDRGSVLVSCPPLTYRPSRCDATGHDKDRWITTGCLGYMDKAGIPRVIGYRSDLVTHEGEEVWLTTLDELLVKHVAVLDAAAVQMKMTVVRMKMTTVTAVKLRAAVVLRETYGGVTAEDISSFVHAQPDCVARLEAVMVVTSIPRAESGRILRHSLAKQLADDLTCSMPWTSV